MKTLVLLEPETLTPEEIQALRKLGFHVELPDELDAELARVAYRIATELMLTRQPLVH